MPKLENIIDTTENCRYCLMCRHVAPVGHVTSQEAYTPHGIALVIASQRRGMVEWNADTVRVIYADPDGGNSRAHCITDQPLPGAIAAVRAELTAAGIAPAAAYDVHERLQADGTPYASQVGDPPEISGDTDAALFASDEAVYLSPGTLDAAHTLLKAVGVSVKVVGYGQSSGFLACSLGFPETATEQAQAVIDALGGAGRLFVLSAGDVFTFSQMIDERLGLSLPDAAELVDLLPYLATAHQAGGLKLKAAPDEQPYAYIDPTHAVRVPKRFDAPRALLAAITGTQPLELFWRRERAHPVGSTALQFTRPDLADQLTRARLQDAQNAGAEVIYCEDPATLHQLRRFADEYGLTVVDLYAFLADNLDI